MIMDDNQQNTSNSNSNSNNGSKPQLIEELSFEDLTFGEQNIGEISFDSNLDLNHHHPSNSLPIRGNSFHYQFNNHNNHHLHPQSQFHLNHNSIPYISPNNNNNSSIPLYKSPINQFNTFIPNNNNSFNNNNINNHHNNNNNINNLHNGQYLGTTPPGVGISAPSIHHKVAKSMKTPSASPSTPNSSLSSQSLLHQAMGANPNSNLGSQKEKRIKPDKSDRHAVLISSKGDKINLALLLKELEECGSVRAHHFRERQNFGFVQFLDTESADNAINKLNNKDIDGHPITVERIKRITPGKDPRISTVGSPQCSSLPTQLPSMIENKPDSTLVLKNLPFNLKQVQLQEILESINPSAPQSVNFHFDNIGVFRGMAFVKYRLVEDAVKVFDALNGTDVHGRRVRLEYKRKVSKSSEIPQEVLEDEQLLKVLDQLKEFRDDASQNEITFSSFTGVQRMYIHNMAEKFKLNHTSIGEEPNRSIVVTKKDLLLLNGSVIIPPNGTTSSGANNTNGVPAGSNQNIFSTTPTSGSLLSSSPQILPIGLSISGGGSNSNSLQGSLSTTPTSLNNSLNNLSGSIGNSNSVNNTTTTSNINNVSNNFNSTIGFNIKSTSSSSSTTPNKSNNSNNSNNNSSSNNNNNSSTLSNILTSATSPSILSPQSPSYLNFGGNSNTNNNSNINQAQNNNNNNLIINDSKIGTSWEKTPANFFTSRVNRDRSYSASAISTDFDSLSTSPSWRKFDSPNNNNNNININNNNIVGGNNSTFTNLLNSTTPNNSFNNGFNFPNQFSLNTTTTTLPKSNVFVSNNFNTNIQVQPQQPPQQQQQQQQPQPNMQTFNLTSPIRQPKGPDGTKGFSDGYKASRKLGQPTLASSAN